MSVVHLSTQTGTSKLARGRFIVSLAQNVGIYMGTTSTNMQLFMNSDTITRRIYVEGPLFYKDSAGTPIIYEVDPNLVFWDGLVPMAASGHQPGEKEQTVPML